MSSKIEDIGNLEAKIGQYQQILANTEEYRKAWKDSLKEFIQTRLSLILDCCGLNAEVIVKDEIENLEAVILSLGKVRSGIGERISEDTVSHMIKNNGLLIYQQLFNGKVQVMIVYPFIEGYGQPQPPKVIGIYRPEELKNPFIIRHMEEFFREIINWEDYDDDEAQPARQQIGFSFDMNDLSES